jgi:hypothetical protein
MDYNNAVRYTVSIPHLKTAWTQVVDHTVTDRGIDVVFECLRPKPEHWPTDEHAVCYSQQYMAWERGEVPLILIEQRNARLARVKHADAWAAHMSEDSSQQR